MTKIEMARTIVSNKEKWLLLNKDDRILLTAYFLLGSYVKLARRLTEEGYKIHESTIRKYVKVAYNNFRNLG